MQVYDDGDNRRQRDGVVDLRKLIFLGFLVRMSDDGVGVEAYYHEKVTSFFNSFGVVVQDVICRYKLMVI